MDIKHNVVGWVEIPAIDLERAVRFYETVFGFTMDRQAMGMQGMAMFPGVPNTIGSGAALVKHPEYKPSRDGVLVYFTAFSGDVATELGRVEKAGGKVVAPKRQITPEIGYMAVFVDSEGNKIALHSRT